MTARVNQNWPETETIEINGDMAAFEFIGACSVCGADALPFVSLCCAAEVLVINRNSEPFSEMARRGR